MGKNRRAEIRQKEKISCKNKEKSKKEEKTMMFILGFILGGLTIYVLISLNIVKTK